MTKVFAEVLRAADEQAFGEIGKGPAGAVDDLHPVGHGLVAFETRQLGVGVELEDLGVDVRLDPAQEVERAVDAGEQPRVDAHEAVEQVGSERPHQVGYRRSGRRAERTHQLHELAVIVGPHRGVAAARGEVARFDDLVGRLLQNRSSTISRNSVNTIPFMSVPPSPPRACCRVAGLS